MDILMEIGLPAMLEQCAEECTELAQTCLKMARKLRGENPTPKTVSEIRGNIKEEMADVRLCIFLLTGPNGLDIRLHDISCIESYKHNRWATRLEEAKKAKPYES